MSHSYSADSTVPEEAPIPGDILEEILSRVSLIDLVSAYAVSSTWRRTVSCSLPRLNTLKPWLIIHLQSTRSPSAMTTHAYDPRSHVWIEIRQPSIHYFSALRSSHSSLLYMSSGSRFVFSTDPLHLEWQEVSAPMGWRPDPIVAAVGNHVIVAGSACGIQDDLPALEIYDTTTRTTDRCDSVPAEVIDSSASTWLSVAVDEHKMYVSLKSSGLTYSFDPKTKNWCGPYDLRPDRDVFYSVIEFAGHRLLLVGLTGDAENVTSVTMWEVKGENNDRHHCQEISKMPWELVEKLKGESSYLPSISLTAMGDFVFVHNPLDPREVIVCEVIQGVCQWGSVRIVGLDDGSRLRRLVLTCSKVSLADLGAALKLGNDHFAVKVLNN